jgi:hypothetical protein
MSYRPFVFSTVDLIRNIPQRLQLRGDVSQVPAHAALGTNVERLEQGRVIAQTQVPDKFVWWKSGTVVHLDRDNDGVADTFVTKDAWEPNKTVSISVGAPAGSDKPHTVYYGPQKVFQVEEVRADGTRDLFSDHYFRRIHPDRVQETRVDLARDGYDGRADVVTMGDVNPNANSGWPFVSYAREDS